MFSKDDFLDFFDQISELENKMVYHAEELSSYIQDPELLKLVNQIKDDELRHLKILDKIKELVVN